MTKIKKRAKMKSTNLNSESSGFQSVKTQGLQVPCSKCRRLFSYVSLDDTGLCVECQIERKGEQFRRYAGIQDTTKEELTPLPVLSVPPKGSSLSFSSPRWGKPAGQIIRARVPTQAARRTRNAAMKQSGYADPILRKYGVV